MHSTRMTQSEHETDLLSATAEALLMFEHYKQVTNGFQGKDYTSRCEMRDGLLHILVVRGASVSPVTPMGRTHEWTRACQKLFQSRLDVWQS
jgi:hypothetical protein